MKHSTDKTGGLPMNKTTRSQQQYGNKPKTDGQGACPLHSGMKGKRKMK